MKKLLQKLFKGYVVLEVMESELSGRIEVRENLAGRRSVVIGGLTQSGESVEKLFEPVMHVLKDRSGGINHCLIFGLGAGSFAKMIATQFPNTKILGVEIDPGIIEIGKRYFSLGEVRNLEIILGDATTIDDQQLAINNFDLILVDCYLGDKYPGELESEEFLDQVKIYLRGDGLIVFNRLYYGSKEVQVDTFEKKLREIFPKVEAGRIKGNKLFLCQKIGTN